MKNLIILDIAHNMIGLEGARFISTMTGLTKLNISHNKIGREGFRTISESLKNVIMWIDEEDNYWHGT